jgi:hypothetical protein
MVYLSISIPFARHFELFSSKVPLGTIQNPPNGGFMGPGAHFFGGYSKSEGRMEQTNPVDPVHIAVILIGL